MRLTFLGTASGLPVPTRFGQTIVLTVDAPTATPRHILLDPGDGASSLLARGGFDHRQIAAIFISHMHADHHGGFAQVVKTCMHLGKRSPLAVYAPEEGIAALQAYLDASYLFAPWLGFELVWVPLTHCLQQETALVDGVRMKVIANAHLRSWRARVAGLAEPPRTCSFESYSAALLASGSRIVYAGNLDGPQGAQEMDGFVHADDVLIMELAHVEPVALGRFLAGRGVRRTIVTHFNPKWDTLSEREILAEIEAGAGSPEAAGPVTLARDALSIAID